MLLIDSALMQASSNSAEKFSVRGDGLVKVTGTFVISMTATNPLSTDACTVGQIAWSTTHLYVCVQSNVNDQWRRVLLADY